MNRMGGAARSYYAVRNGRKTGIFSSWEECSEHVSGYSGAVFKKFKNAQDAQAFLNGNPKSSAPSTSANKPRNVIPTVRSKNSGYSPMFSHIAINQFPTSGIARSNSEKIQKTSSSNSNQTGSNTQYIGLKGNLTSYTPSSDAADEYNIYTDGSCIGNRNVANSKQPAGWGAVILKNTVDHAMIYGPVDLNPSSREYLGAEVGSNNTGELSAIGNAFRYMILKAENSEIVTPSRGVKTKIKIHFDSNYAAKSITGEFNGEKNKLLITQCRSLYKLATRYYDVTFVKVAGHSGDYNNDRADSCARLGAYARETTWE